LTPSSPSRSPAEPITPSDPDVISILTHENLSQPQFRPREDSPDFLYNVGPSATDTPSAVITAHEF